MASRAYCWASGFSHPFPWSSEVHCVKVCFFLLMSVCVSCGFCSCPVNSEGTGWMFSPVQLCSMWVTLLPWSWPAECVLPLCCSACKSCHFWAERAFYLGSLSELTRSLYSSWVGYLANKLIFCHLRLPLLQLWMVRVHLLSLHGSWGNSNFTAAAFGPGADHRACRAYSSTNSYQILLTSVRLSSSS